ncbi:hypothetical protein AMATHDRAFT_59548 [Amanita thiersii Skay4041]|uniref:Uncharacterized protein n=1 Tax=Amanita thiersii Skay4041 TaxID=703135 RepID=A0A2A9NPJ7_9AGAR|nr:hypothetical protein AMATHDRAFT_59548 [Amanita thiersii Skay4041]
MSTVNRRYDSGKPIQARKSGSYREPAKAISSTQQRGSPAVAALAWEIFRSSATSRCLYKDH